MSISVWGNVLVFASMVERRKTTCHMRVNISTSFWVCAEFSTNYYVLLVSVDVVYGVVC